MCRFSQASKSNESTVRPWRPSLAMGSLWLTLGMCWKVPWAEGEVLEDVGVGSEYDRIHSSVTTTERILGFSKSFPLKHIFPNHTLRCAPPWTLALSSVSFALFIPTYLGGSECVFSVSSLFRAFSSLQKLRRSWFETVTRLSEKKEHDSSWGLYNFHSALCSVEKRGHYRRI